MSFLLLFHASGSFANAKLSKIIKAYKLNCQSPGFENIFGSGFKYLRIVN
jgi:hypothetical protein